MIAHFSLRLVCGISLMWVFMHRRDVSSGFFRIQMLLSLGLSVLAALTAATLVGREQGGSNPLSPRAATAVCGVLAGLSFVGSVLWTLERRMAGSVFAHLVAACSAGLLFAVMLSNAGDDDRAVVMARQVLSGLSAAALLGSAVTGMLLGHWYLTAPGMPLYPLQRMTQVLAVCTLLRLAVCGEALAADWRDMQVDLHAIWLTLRWLAGIAAPLMAAAMVWRILRYRNTQSATGVLFATVILVFIGELTAMLLEREFHR